MIEHVGAPHLPPDILDGLPIAVLVLAGDGTPVYANPAAHHLLGADPERTGTPADLAAGYPAVLAGTGRPYPAERTPILRALAGEACTVGDMEIERPGGPVPVEVWAGPIFGPDSRVAYAVAAFYDVSERRRAEVETARLHAETVRQSRWLAAVREVQFTVLSGAGVDDALELVARQARDLIAGDSTSIGIPDGEGALQIRAADGLHAEMLRGQRLSTADSIMGQIIAMGAAAVLDDISSHGTLADPVVQLGLGPAVFVPLSADGRAFGSLCIARGQGGMLFSEQEVAAAEAFANQAAMAVQIGWSQRELQVLGTHTVRSLLSVCGQLAGLRAGDTDAADSGAVLDIALKDLDEVISDLRRAASGLDSPAPARLGLQDGIIAAAREFEVRTGIVTAVDVHLDDTLLAGFAPRAQGLRELIRRLLADVCGRPGTRTCAIRLGSVGDGVIVHIDDDGPPCDPSLLAELLEALAGLADLAGCRVEPVTTGGVGTSVRVVLATGDR